MATKKPKKPKTKKGPGSGRPSKYSASYAPKIAEIMARHGMIDRDMAAFMGISESTFNKWKRDFPEFKKALDRGKAEIDDKVENALLQRALGYEHPEDVIMQYQGEPVIVPTIKHYPPDNVSCIFWLKNRRPDRWRDKQELEIDFENDPVTKLADAINNFKLSDEPPPV